MKHGAGREFRLQAADDIEKLGLIGVSHRLAFIERRRFYYGSASLDVLERLQDVALPTPQIASQAQINSVQAGHDFLSAEDHLAIGEMLCMDWIVVKRDRVIPAKVRPDVCLDSRIVLRRDV